MIKVLITVLVSYVLNAQDLSFDKNKKFDIPDVKLNSPSKAIYGNNSLNDYYNVPEYLKKIADSTVAFIPKTLLEFDSTTNEYKPKKLIDLTVAMYADPNEDFSKQISLSQCSGAYVGKSYILTAGHCVDPENYQNVYIVFGWRYEAQDKPVLSFSKDQVYTIKEINVRKLEYVANTLQDALDKNKDYALITLDRQPSGKKALSIEKNEDVKVNDQVYTIGYPLGLGVKITNPQDAKVFYTGLTNFQTNLDAFGGNSGGACFNSKTNKIVGVLVTAIGPEYYYELKDAVDFTVSIDSTTSGKLLINNETKELIVSSDISTKFITNLMQNYDVTINPIDKTKYSVVFKKGNKIETRDPMFKAIVVLDGIGSFTRGRFVRFDQNDFGTGVMKVPQEIKDLI